MAHRVYQRHAMMLLFQLGACAAMNAGLGYGVWLASGRPSPTRHAAWLWCGLIGLSLGLLALQALVYLDFPLRKTVPALAVLAGAGLLGLGVQLWRARRGGVARWREVLWILGAGVGAAAVQSTSVVGVGSDRFLGHAQIDHVNYVLVAQFLADEPFSTEVAEVGLRPWLWRSFELKHHRITQCVALGAAAVLTGSDAQRAWGAVAVGFLALLAMALAAAWRVAAAVPARPAALLGLAGACLPVVTQVYLLGYFSQLASLFVFPALIAVARPGAFPSRRALLWTTCLLGYLAGTYSEFWPIGVAIAGGLILRWPLRWWKRVGAVGWVTAGSVVLTGAYALELPRIILPRLSGVVQNAGFAPDGISWLGWGRNFFAGVSPWLEAAGGAILVGGVMGVLLQAKHRRLDWLLALAAPVALAAWWMTAAETPVYATYKLLATFSPLCAGLAMLGGMGLAARAGRRIRSVAAVLLFVAGGFAVFGGFALHRTLVHETLSTQRERLEKLWAARARVEAARGVYLIERGNGLIGAWLAFFARDSQVYYDLPALSDRRVPSESAAFRKIPPGVALQWLDLDRVGPVPAREGSPRVTLTGARSTFETAGRRVYVLGSVTELALECDEAVPPEPREFVLECGLTPLPQAGACHVTVVDETGVVGELALTAPRPVSVPVKLRPGRTVLRWNIQPADGTKTDQDLVLLQALSIERIAIGGP